MDAFKNDDRRCFDCLRYIGSLVECEVISWDLNVLTLEQLLKLFESQVEIQGARVVEIVVGSIFVVLITTQRYRKSASAAKHTHGEALTRGLCKTCRGRLTRFDA